MTCVIGSVDGGTVWMGADSAGVAGYAMQRRKDEKVFINGKFIIGFTSSFRMGQLLRYSFSPPARKEGQELFDYMVNDFVGSVRRCLKDGGYSQISSNEETGGTFLVGYEGRLFVVDSDYQVAEMTGDFAAVGCGEDIALGSMYSTRGNPVEDRIRTALAAAEEFSAGVRGPFHILKLGG